MLQYEDLIVTSVVGWALVGLGSWWGNGSPSHRSLTGVGARAVAVGQKSNPNLKGSSEEFWTMDKRSIQ